MRTQGYDKTPDIKLEVPIGMSSYPFLNMYKFLCLCLADLWYQFYASKLGISFSENLWQRFHTFVCRSMVQVLCFCHADWWCMFQAFLSCRSIVCTALQIFGKVLFFFFKPFSYHILW